MTKQEILSTLDNEIGSPQLSHTMGVRNYNEIYTDSLLIQFSFYEDSLHDIMVSSTINYPPKIEVIVYADELNEERIIRILQAAQLEDYASNMGVVIST